MPSIDEIKEAQRRSWNQFAPGWKKWDEFVMEKLRPIGEALLASVRLRDGCHVLDVATGTGEPGLTAATRVGSGRVIGIDLAEEMVRIAQENAAARGITNYEALNMDATALHFGDNSFDAVICRFGVMFFPDPAVALAEMTRVTKSRGMVAVSAWGPPPDNPWVTIIAGCVNRMLNVPPPPPDSIGVFRFGNPGSLTSLFQQAGLREVSELRVAGEMNYDSPDHYWEMMTDVAAPIATALNQTDVATRASVKQAVIEDIQLKNSNGRLTMPWTAWVAVGVKL